MKMDSEDKILLDGAVWINPERVSGVPCFNQTRVPIAHLFDYLKGEDYSLEEFLDGYPGVTREQVIKVIEFSQKSVLFYLTET